MDDINPILRSLEREIWLVTAEHAGRRGGLIATFVSHATIVPELPRMLIGIAKQHYTHGLIEASQSFTLHLLDESKIDLVWRFGLQSGHQVDKFANFTGLGDVTARLECRVETSMDTGDRTVFLGEVVDAALGKQAPPLTTKLLLELAPPERLSALRALLQRDGAIDAAAIRQWRGV